MTNWLVRSTNVVASAVLPCSAGLMLVVGMAQVPHQLAFELLRGLGVEEMLWSSVSVDTRHP